MKTNGSTQPVEWGEHIVADPKVCHGKPTFKGTRIMVFQVLEQVACGTPWEQIVWSWRGKVPMEAISEAVKLASRLFKRKQFFRHMLVIATDLDLWPIRLRTLIMLRKPAIPPSHA